MFLTQFITCMCVYQVMGIQYVDIWRELKGLELFSTTTVLSHAYTSQKFSIFPHRSKLGFCCTLTRKEPCISLQCVTLTWSDCKPAVSRCALISSSSLKRPLIFMWSCDHIKFQYSYSCTNKLKQTRTIVTMYTYTCSTWHKLEFKVHVRLVNTSYALNHKNRRKT